MSEFDKYITDIQKIIHKEGIDEKGNLNAYGALICIFTSIAIITAIIKLKLKHEKISN